MLRTCVHWYVPEAISRVSLFQPVPKSQHPMTPGRREWLITTYLAERLREAGSEGHMAWEMVNDLVDNDADLAWSVLLELVERAQTRQQLGMIAAGPLESFIRTHWKEWIDRVEHQAGRDARLRYCLSGIYASSLPLDYQTRLRRLADETVPDDLTP